MNQLPARRCDSRAEATNPVSNWNALEEDARTALALRSDFTNTHWSVVLAAGDNSSPSSAAALEKLCRAYWYPLYAYVRRRGHGPEDSQDLTQDFFARLLRKEYLSHVEPERGKFRTFLLTSLKRFLINEWEKGRVQKRGGGQPVLSLDTDATESRYQAEPSESSTPEKIFEKRWAVTLLEQVLARLRQEFTAHGKAQQFERLKLLLWGEKGSPPYAEVAAELGLSEGALKVSVHRLRQRYRELLREEVAHTVASPSDVDNELRHLIAVISEQ
jgi:RNA polymerase sigma factor (sigma-70 family)